VTVNDRILVATRKGLFTLTRNSHGWSVAALAFPGVPVTAALADPRDGTLYAALKHGHFGPKLHRSEDGGDTWREIGTPVFPADADGAPALSQMFTIESGGAGEPGRLWIGAVPAGLFRSDDHGDSWELVRPLWDVPSRPKWFGGGNEDTAMHTVSPDPRDSERLMIAISCAGVWETTDGGAHWTVQGEGLIATYMPPELQGAREVQDPHRVARCAAEPNVMWMQHHNGIFRSTDAGLHWTQLKPPGDDFGFAVAAHPREPGTAWFVPAVKDEIRMPRDGALCVTRTGDGGKTWETLRDGLPQRDAYDLIYRHGLDADDTGERLAMGSTTGALWTSDNGGERWQLVNAHLPPIYAVRFG
jgi:photosystem II stability/assembly factor-like uncharacterized protein